MTGVRRLGLGEQLAYLRVHWPNFRSRLEKGKLTSIGELQPTELSSTYTVEVSQPGGGCPEVRVLQPELKRGPNDEDIPHMYMQERLCLYLPGSGEWKPDDPIALTIIPWASLWLYFYEVWRATNEWLGGGVHPSIHIPVRREVTHARPW
jgi:hypothetical protein